MATVTAFTSGVTPERCPLFSAIMGESPMFGNFGDLKLWSDSGEPVTFRDRLLDVEMIPLMSVLWERLPCSFWSHLTPYVTKVQVTNSPV